MTGTDDYRPLSKGPHLGVVLERLSEAQRGLVLPVHPQVQRLHAAQDEVRRVLLEGKKR